MECLRGGTPQDAAKDFLVNPFRCRMWGLHDRLDEYLTEETCKAEIESFTKHGQLVPVLGRRLLADPEHDVELIYGARRLFIARHINVPLLVRIRDISDREAMIAMDIENRQRKDISPYERGLSYLRLLRSGCFKSQEEIAQTLQVSPSVVSRLLKLARLPSVIVGAFQSPVDIQEGWGLDLAEAWNDPDRRAALSRRARALGTQRGHTSPRQIYELLLKTEFEPRRLRAARQVEVVRGSNGTTLFKMSRQRRAIVLSLPAEGMSGSVLSEIKHRVAEILQGARQSARSYGDGNRPAVGESTAHGRPSFPSVDPPSAP